ncbi:MAG TPA: hypothetical protein VFF06_28200, partial [Polyangia bacterium]|nr:hypothetical protein [Polyangia bacterium]
MKIVEVGVGDAIVRYDVEGETTVGADEVLLDGDDDLTRSAAWAADGYTVAPFLDDACYRQLVEGIRRLLFDLAEPHLPIAFEQFQMDRYHEWVQSNDVHLKIAYANRDGFAVDRLPIDVALVERRVSELCGAEVRSMGVFCVRIVRPGVRSDNNPPHRDVWL